MSQTERFAADLARVLQALRREGKPTPKVETRPRRKPTARGTSLK